ncbi:unnamed protein product [Cuscuta campestris]|uniref:Retrotransposon gag domain-containing protein n=1 Tax=Cuscuta campestris TaxID=132261 RepID=A0A484N546_9ASTE|nr:unnamed protein product [Cuscuta campestris]
MPAVLRETRMEWKEELPQWRSPARRLETLLGVIRQCWRSPAGRLEKLPGVNRQCWKLVLAGLVAVRHEQQLVAVSHEQQLVPVSHEHPPLLLKRVPHSQETPHMSYCRHALQQHGPHGIVGREKHGAAACRVRWILCHQWCSDHARGLSRHCHAPNPLDSHGVGASLDTGRTNEVSSYDDDEELRTEERMDRSRRDSRPEENGGADRLQTVDRMDHSVVHGRPSKRMTFRWEMIKRSTVMWKTVDRLLRQKASDPEQLQTVDPVDRSTDGGRPSSSQQAVENLGCGQRKDSVETYKAMKGTFNSRGSRWLTKRFMNARNKNKKPKFIGTDHWGVMLQYWASLEFRVKSEKTRRNKKSEKAKQRQYYGGRRSVREHVKKMEMEDKVVPTQLEIINRLFLKKRAEPSEEVAQIKEKLVQKKQAVSRSRSNSVDMEDIVDEELEDDLGLEGSGSAVPEEEESFAFMSTGVDMGRQETIPARSRMSWVNCVYEGKDPELLGGDFTGFGHDSEKEKRRLPVRGGNGGSRAAAGAGTMPLQAPMAVASFQTPVPQPSPFQPQLVSAMAPVNLAGALNAAGPSRPLQATDPQITPDGHCVSIESDDGEWDIPRAHKKKKGKNIQPATSRNSAFERLGIGRKARGIKIDAPRFTGKEDPEIHLDSFNQSATMNGCTDEEKCLLFFQTLRNRATEWFNKLRPGSIDSFSDLASKFKAKFPENCTKRKKFTYLSTAGQRESENLTQFLTRWKEEVDKVEEMDDKTVLSLLLNGLRAGELYKEFCRKPPATYQEAYHTAWEFAEAETQLRAKREAEHGHKPKPVQVKNEEAPGPSRPRHHYDPMIDSGELGKDYLQKAQEKSHQWVRPTAPGDDRDNDRRRNNRPRERQPAPEKEHIGMIFGGPEGGDSAAQRKNWVRSIYVGEVSAEPPRRKHTRREPIVFTDRDLPPTGEDHNDPLVITMDINGVDVARVLVDTGSSVNILYLETFQKLRLCRTQLEPLKTPLSGFTGDTVEAEGSIVLPVELGSGEKTVWKKMRFIVVDIRCVHNTILGRPGINRVRAVISMPHLCIMFHTPGGVGEVKGDQRNARECYARAVKKMTKGVNVISQEITKGETREKLEPEAETVEIELHPGDSSRMVRIGANLPEDLKAQITRVLQQYAGIFAWSVADMPGIDRSVICHRLAVREGSRPVRQKKRYLASDRREFVKKEVKDLLSVDKVIKENFEVLPVRNNWEVV